MRIRSLITFLLLVSLSSVAVAGEGPRISFEKYAHDYGRVLSGNTVTEEFSFTNTGDETLIIEKLRSSCGCTKAVKGSREVPPNGKSTIVAAFDTTGLRPGRKSKTIYVHTNDPKNKIVKLKLLADVVREIHVDPPTLAKQLPKFVDHVEFPMKIRNSSKKACKIIGVKVPPDGVTASIKPGNIVVEPGATVPFDLVLNLKKESGRHLLYGETPPRHRSRTGTGNRSPPISSNSQRWSSVPRRRGHPRRPCPASTPELLKKERKSHVVGVMSSLPTRNRPGVSRRVAARCPFHCRLQHVPWRANSLVVFRRTSCVGC